jgi:5-(aminomethyl)-3-furanmethanol phosphate kinase
MGAARLTIVKLGGSLAGSRRLPDWVAAAAACAGRVVLVPGGGPFADAVRREQARFGFDDRAAHRMALLAMEQYGYALASLDDRLKLADSAAAIRRCLRAGEVPVWSPARMVLRAAEIPGSWDVTSDSLAAWLAGRLGAAGVVLVKQARLKMKSLGARQLAADGVVDPAFPQFLRRGGAVALILHAARPAALREAVHGVPSAGVRILFP